MSTKSVLVIDDDLELAEAISLVLSNEGYDVRCANTGAQGLASALECPPDTIMLDWQMPTLSGREVLSVLEAQETLRKVPLILMSAHLESIPSESLEKHLHVSKPFNLELLIRRVQEAQAVKARN